MLLLPDLLTRMPVARPPDRASVNVTIHEPAVRDALEDTQPRFLDVILPAVVKQNTVCAVTLASANHIHNVVLNKQHRTIEFKAFQPLGSPYTRVTAHLMPPAFCRMFLHSTLAEDGGADLVRQTFAAIGNRQLARDLLDMLDDELRARVFAPPALEGVLDGTVSSLAPLVQLPPAWLDAAQAWLLAHALQTDSATATQRRRLHTFLRDDPRWAQRRQSLLQAIEQRLMGGGGNDSDHEVPVGTRRVRDGSLADTRAEPPPPQSPRSPSPPVSFSPVPPQSPPSPQSPPPPPSPPVSMSPMPPPSPPSPQSPPPQDDNDDGVNGSSSGGERDGVSNALSNQLTRALRTVATGRWTPEHLDLVLAASGETSTEMFWNRHQGDACNKLRAVADSTRIEDRELRISFRHVALPFTYWRRNSYTTDCIYDTLRRAIADDLEWSCLERLFMHLFYADKYHEPTMDWDVIARLCETKYLQDASTRLYRAAVLLEHPYVRLRWCTSELRNSLPVNMHVDYSLSEMTYDQVIDRQGCVVEYEELFDPIDTWKSENLRSTTCVIYWARIESSSESWEPFRRGEGSCLIQEQHLQDDAPVQFIMTCMDAFSLPNNMTEAEAADAQRRFNAAFHATHNVEAFVRAAITMITECCISGPRTILLFNYLMNTSSPVDGHASMFTATRAYVERNSSRDATWLRLCILGGSVSEAVRTNVERAVREWQEPSSPGNRNVVYDQFWEPMRRAAFIHMPRPVPLGGGQTFWDSNRRAVLPADDTVHLKNIAHTMYDLFCHRDVANENEARNLNQDSGSVSIGAPNSRLGLEFTSVNRPPLLYTLQIPNRAQPTWAVEDGAFPLPYCMFTYNRT